MTPKEFDDQIQIQLDVVTKILAASGQSQEAAKAAISALDELRLKIAANLDALTQSVINKIDASAKEGATEAAKLLQQKFTQADEQAVLAAGRYERAARWLGFKIFIIVTCSAIATLGIALLIALRFIPAREEIDARRQALAAMESRALYLERQGVNLEWGTCGGSLCFRTIEKEGVWGSNDETWRRPYKKP